MRALLLATGFYSEIEPLLRLRPSPMINIGNKPIVGHIIETLVQQKVTNLDIVLCHLPQNIEEYIGEGSRWGVHITYHIVKDINKPFEVLNPIIKGWEDKTFLIGSGDYLPQFNLEQLEKIHSDTHMPVFIFASSHEWSGWGLVPTKLFEKIHNDITYEALPDQLRSDQYRVVWSHAYISSQTYNDILKSNEKVITNKGDRYLLPTTARQTAQDVWVSYGCDIHPSARLMPPVFIGDHCQIKSDAQIGPQAYIGKNCVIDAKSTITRSVINEYSYVGEGLDVRNCIVDKHLLINLELDVYTVINDEVILGTLPSTPAPFKITDLLSSTIGGLLLVLMSPFYLYMWLTHDIQRDKYLQLPSPQEDLLWKNVEILSFKNKNQKTPRFLTYLPYLWHISRGELHFTGVPLRTLDEVKKLPEDWRYFYLRSQAGFITLAEVESGPNPSEDDLFVSEAYYSVHSSLWYNIKLIFKYLVRCF
jgi:NDP-sugar pyrophosphorylase family protein